MSSATKTFAKLYCERHHLASSQYEDAFFAEVLYPHARSVARVLRWWRPNFFTADYAYLRGVGMIVRTRQLNEESRFFHDHPQNAGLLRTLFRVRVSTERVRTVVKELLPVVGEGQSLAPFTPRRDAA